jgi:hypothetical protein
VVLDVSELSTMDATAQAELVRGKELTPLELVDAEIARIERVNPTLNAVITPLCEDASAAAVSPDLPDGPFRGGPFLLKDIDEMSLDRRWIRRLPYHRYYGVFREWRARARPGAALD